MQDFDNYLADDLTFRVRGEIFQMEYVDAMVFAKLQDDQQVKQQEALAAIEANTYDASTDAQDTVANLHDQIMALLRPEDRERWQKLRDDEKTPIPYFQLQATRDWMVEQQTARPTQPPSPSAPGRGSSVRSSTVKPRSTEAAVA
jgi:putative SOS response-associated peptidase YedK